MHMLMEKKRRYVRTGCVYCEFTNRGRTSPRFARGSRPERMFRYVGEITVRGKRFRFRSTNLNNVRLWVDSMVKRHEDE